MKLRWFTPEIMQKYPHLGKKEGQIFSNFLNTNSRPIVRIAYDIPVGVTSMPASTAPENYKRDWRYLASYKIDALIDFGNTFCICEVKPRANPSGYGQLIVYKWLLNKLMDLPGNIELMIICESCPSVLLPFLDENNIKVHENYKFSLNSKTLNRSAM
jgi:hypothetical protein